LQALEERRRASELAARAQEELAAARAQLKEQLSEVCRKHEEKVQELEKRLENALGESLFTALNPLIKLL